MILEDLLKIQEEKKKKEIQLYKNILNDVENQIQIYATYNKIALIYKIPCLIFGYPSIDIPKTMEYIIGSLNHKGFIAIQLSPDSLYISWELAEILKNNILKEQKQSKEALERLKSKRELDMNDSIVKRNR